MVYKVSKGGVRSGNTLRCLSSYSTRRYAQGCIVGRSNLNPHEAITFLDSHIQNKMISSALSSTDVALSLNKKKRWLLPATVGHMIKTGSFSEDKTIVSLLERHKLKRRTNCISFVSNQGRLHAIPTQRKYFCFNINKIGNTQSNKVKESIKTEIMEQAKITDVKITTDQNEMPVKTVEVFTILGSAKKRAEWRNSFVSSKPEYRLEVIYPCPSTCSLAYNPKYTNVHMEFGEEGGMELKSDRRVSKKGRKRKKVYLIRDLETDESELVLNHSNAVKSEKKVMKNERWHRRHFLLEDLKRNKTNILSDDETETVGNDHDEYTYDEILSDARNKISDHHTLKNTCEQLDFENDVSYVRRGESIFADLVTQAEEAKSLRGNSKRRNKRKRSRKNYSQCESGSYTKSHIVYTSEVNPRLKHDRKKKRTEPTSTYLGTRYMTLHSAKVILKSAEATPGNLRATYGRLYAEAESEPRRFLIDVTEDIQNLLCPYRNTEQSAVYTSFLVFVHDGVYDEGLDTYRVIFNSNCCTETTAIKSYFPFEKTTFGEIMNRVASLVLDMKGKNILDITTDQHYGTAPMPLMKFLNNLYKYSFQAFRSCDEIRRVSQTEVMQESVNFSRSLEGFARSLDFETLCGICYEQISLICAWSKCGTKLSKCSHIFCDECWRSHFRAKLKGGSVKIACPGYECDQTVGPVTLLSLVHVTEVSKLFQRMREEETDSSSNSKWCPNRDCGRIIKLDTERTTNDMSLDVICSCGQEFCFSCLSNPHWPATCEQAEKYTNKLHEQQNLNSSETMKDSSRTRNMNKPFEVEGRLCPNCSKFIQKEGGCRYIYCRCGHNFCWNCLQALMSHKHCVPSESILFESTIRLKVSHRVNPTSFRLLSESTNKQKQNEYRQRRALFTKAVDERQKAHCCTYVREINDMMKQIARVSHRNILLKREFMSICDFRFDGQDTDNSGLLQLVSKISKFLRSCCEIKRALHHVAEFTFVLLQDAPDSVDKRRTLRLANNMSNCCILMESILESSYRQDTLIAVKVLVEIQAWAKWALNVILFNVDKLKC